MINCDETIDSTKPPLSTTKMRKLLKLLKKIEKFDSSFPPETFDLDLECIGAHDDPEEPSPCDGDHLGCSSTHGSDEADHMRTSCRGNPKSSKFISNIGSYKAYISSLNRSSEPVSSRYSPSGSQETKTAEEEQNPAGSSNTDTGNYRDSLNRSFVSVLELKAEDIDRRRRRNRDKILKMYFMDDDSSDDGNLEDSLKDADTEEKGNRSSMLSLASIPENSSHFAMTEKFSETSNFRNSTPIGRSKSFSHYTPPRTSDKKYPVSLDRITRNRNQDDRIDDQSFDFETLRKSFMALETTNSAAQKPITPASNKGTYRYKNFAHCEGTETPPKSSQETHQGNFGTRRDGQDARELRDGEEKDEEMTDVENSLRSLEEKIGLLTSRIVALDSHFSNEY